MSDRKTEREKVAVRIRALLAKTKENGCSEGEAMAAALKARELADKYQINLSETELEAEGVVQGTAEAPAARKFDLQPYLVGPIADFTDCRTWRTTVYVTEDGELADGPWNGEAEERWQFLGLQSDVEFAFWLLVHLEDFIWDKADAYVDEHGGGWLETKTFAVGCLTRIAERLREESSKRRLAAPVVTSTGRSLVVVKNAMVETVYVSLNLRLRSTGNRIGRMGSGDAYSAGRAAGNSAGFGRPANNGGGTKLLR